MNLNVEIRKPMEKDAFAMLRNNIGMLDWYAAHNRPYQERLLHLLNLDLVEEMIADRKLVTSETYKMFDEKYFERFVVELYSTYKYELIIEKMNEFIPMIKQVGNKFEALKKSWGFKIFDQYYIDMDYFGAGGKYDSEKGRVIFGLKGGQFLSVKSAGTLIHEMIHLGIEDLIVNPEKRNIPRIAQEEKERIVDNLCIYVMDGIMDSRRMDRKDGTISSYQEVADCAAYMDEVVGRQPENNLVEAVEKFLKNSENSKIRYFNK